tara:strand:+ start:174 stop:713 length:540 start_codon:yes stop_codon:yes gene_type:complete
MELTTAKIAQTFEVLKEKLSLSNIMQTPKVEKVVVSVGIGSVKDKNKLALIENRLMKITGQKPRKNPAKKSIAAFKLREGDLVGYQVTLRGDRMRSFIDKLVHIALPRTKDFRGIETKGFDNMGNYTLGIKEHTIFPETSDEDVRDIFGMSVTFVTTADTKEKAKMLLDYLGMPFKKEE